VRILLVDDSALARGIVGQVLEEAGFTVVGQASTGLKGVEMTRDLRPDLVIMDVHMPVMDGLAATQRIMAEAPTPILIFTTEVETKVGFEAVAAGALEVMLKPQISDLNDPGFLEVFLQKIRQLSRPGGASPLSTGTKKSPGHRPGDFRMVVVGASTGGPLAVRTILAALPGNFPLPLVVVQHLEQGFEASYAEWLQEQSALAVRLAGPEATPQPGTVVVGRPGRHLKFEGSSLGLDDGPAVLNQKPAVDVLFASAAKAYGNRTLGVLLTGMGSDGADGCVAIRRAGGLTLVQNQETSAIWGMPRVATERGGASEILGLEEFAARLVHWAGGPP